MDYTDYSLEWENEDFFNEPEDYSCDWDDDWDDDDYLLDEVGFNPYTGCYDDDC